MKLRFPPQLKADLEARADLMGESKAEMVRRAIRKYNRAGGVALPEIMETATRKNNPIEVDLRVIDHLYGHRKILQIVRWALDDSKPEPVELSPQAKKDAAYLRRQRAALKDAPWRGEA